MTPAEESLGKSSGDETERFAESRVGRVLADKWRLERVLGVGGMAAVYAATHKNNLKGVAIKMLHPQMAANPDIKARFLREGYVSNKVGHPGAVSVIDDGTDEDGTPFLVMELLAGESLDGRAQLRGGTMPVREMFEIALGVLEVLAKAHEQGIVHRDLKPDNVFVTKDGAVKVLDFGVARIREGADDASDKTRSGVVMGTPEYMPPEQARGRSEEVDARADIFAVGAMMFRLLTGRHAHVADTGNEVLLLAMTEPAPKVATLLKEIEPAAAEVIDRAMAFAKEDRFPDAQAMYDAVKAAIDEIDHFDSKVTLVPNVEQQAKFDAVDRARSLASAKTLEPTPASKKNLWIHQKPTEATPIASVGEARGSRRLPKIVLALVALVSIGLALRFSLRGHAVASPAEAPDAAPPVAVPGSAPRDPDPGDASADPDADDEDDDLEIYDAASVQPAPLGAPAPHKPPIKVPKKKKKKGK